MTDCGRSLAPGGAILRLVSCDLPRPLTISREPGDPDGLGTDQSTAATVRRMCAHIADAIGDSAVRDWVRAALRSPGAAASSRAAAGAWWWYVKHNVFFREDSDAIESLLNETDQLELLISPSVLVRMRRPEEDCDGFTMLVLAGLAILGVPCFVCTIAAEPGSPRRWSHVYAVASFGSELVAFDCSHGDYPGWEVPAERQYRRQLWNLAGEPVGGEVSQVTNKGLHGYVATRRPAIARRGRAGLGFSALPGTVDVGGGASWNTVLQQLALQGGNIAQQVLAPLRPGEFVQTAAGVRSREVAGAVPDPWASASSRGGSSTSVVASPGVPGWLLVGGGVLGVVLLVSMMRRS